MSTFRPLTLRLLALGASLALGGTSVVQADNSPDQAQQGAAQADASLNAANTRVEVARVSAESAKGKVTEISSQLEADQHEANTIRRRLFDAESGLRQLQQAVENATGRFEARRKEIVAEGARYALLRDAVEQARLDAVRDFNSSPEYRAALEAVQTNSANRRQAKAALDELRNRFMEELLPRTPKVAVAEQALKVEQDQIDALSAAASAAEKQLADAQANLKHQSDGMANDRVALDELTADISKCQAELPGAEADAEQATSDLNRAVEYAEASRQSRESAYAALQPVTAPPAPVYQSSMYGSYPPAVVYVQPRTVYVQPGSVYVGTPYFGSYIVQARPSTFGWGTGRVYGTRVYASHVHSHRGHR